MPFVLNGGLFLKTETKPFSLGDKVALKLSFWDRELVYETVGKIVWISPTGPKQPSGIGVQLNDQDDSELKGIIEKLLSHKLHRNIPTYTM